MPTTFTHDLFGREVYHRLPKQMRHMIRRNGSLYRIGLHGPDILFYYRLYKNPVNQLGAKLHQEIAKPFFEEGLDEVRDTKNEALFVYLLGFACHFLLDSTCHPYINGIESEVSHTLIEKELDRMLMEEDGKDSFNYYPSCCIRPTKAGAQVIQNMFPELKAKTVYDSLVMMKRTTNLMVYQDSLGQKALIFLLKALGQGKFSEHIMRKEKDPSLDPYLLVLKKLFWKAREEAPALLESMFHYVKAGDSLPARFARNYE